MTGGTAGSERRRQLPALTGLRFFAALHVMLLHYVWDYVPHEGPLPGGVVARGVLSSGYLGVSLFFVLSGFILTYNYLDASGARRVDRGAFWNARIARVYPAYLLSLLVALPAVWRWASAKVAVESLGTAIPKVIAVAALNPSLLQAWVPPTVPPWNAPGWSLSVEAAFYALFPFVALPFGERGIRAPVRTGIVLWLSALAVPTLYCAVADAPYLSPVGTAQPTMLLTAISYFPLLHVPEFLIGMLAGRLFLTRDARDTGAGRAAWGLCADAVVLAYLLVLVVTPKLPYPLLHNGLLGPLYALLIFSLAAGDGVASRLLSMPALVLLGEASYALYLLHLPMLGRVSELVDLVSSPTRRTGWLANGVAAGASLVLSIAVLKLVEEPARRSVRRRLDVRLARRRRAREVASGALAD